MTTLWLYVSRFGIELRGGVYGLTWMRTRSRFSDSAEDDVHLEVCNHEGFCSGDVCQ